MRRESVSWRSINPEPPTFNIQHSTSRMDIAALNHFQIVKEGKISEDKIDRIPP
jgi:hypothetical protein